jgi:ubiquitin-protein ligase
LYLLDPLENQINNHFLNNRAEAEAKAREWTKLYAKG